MSDNARIPAATYLRMSTERQQYSLLNQSEVIAQYADAHGFVIVKTYSDAARTGVVFGKRKGLQGLIQDVVQDAASFKAVLVYDVSRWGRFQDTDESAHYEFLCKSAGIPVHYCAEPFANDSGLSGLIMKSLKRVMAGEYSRELGVKTFNAQKRFACMGFWQGGPPGYGLQRLLLSADGKPKQILHHGERKSLASDRVVLTPGPPDEVRCVHEIYRLFLEEKLSFLAIAQELNRRKIPYIRGAQWNGTAVASVLTSPKYAGINQFGRFSTRLYTPKIENPRSEWTYLHGAFEPTVDPEMFEEVQETLAALPRNRSNESLLETIRAVLVKEGKLTMRLLERTPGLPSASAIRERFGSMSHVYDLIGYPGNDGYPRGGKLEEIRRVRNMRQVLMNEIVAVSGGRVQIENQEGRFRTRLRLPEGRQVAVIVCRCFRCRKNDRWLMKVISRDKRLVAFVIRLDRANDVFMDCFVVPPISAFKYIYLKKDDPRLNKVIRLTDLRGFVTAVRTVATQPPIIWRVTETRTAVANRQQMRRLERHTKAELMRRGLHQRTLERIYSRRPVYPSTLARCLKALAECEAERRPND